MYHRTGVAGSVLKIPDRPSLSWPYGRDPRDDTRGIVRPDRLGRFFHLERLTPPAPVDRVVDRFWLVSWNLPAGRHHEQRVVTHPAVNLVFEDRGVTVSGVLTESFVRELAGEGRAMGVMFRPGGLQPFLGRPLSTVTDRVLSIGEVFGPEGVELAASLDLEDVHAAVTRVGAFLAARAPSEPTTGEEVSAIVELIQADRTVSTVAGLAERLDVHPRRLQRLFSKYVGVSPRWIIRRARLHAAAEEAKDPQPRSWGELAAALGYSDQAHLTRNFTQAVGDPPARYADQVDLRRDD